MKAEETKLTNENASPVKNVFDSLNFSDDIDIFDKKRSKTPQKSDGIIIFSDIETPTKTFVI